jgi:F-type H+-transporting ATPase subunit epsilon
MDRVKLTIVTPNGLIFDDNVKSVTLPGKEGEFGVLPGHVSIVSLLTAGIIEYQKEDDSIESIAINWGHVNVSSTNVDVLVDGAVALSVDSDSDVAKAIDNAKKLLEDVQDSSKILASVEAKIESSAKGLV